MSNILWAQGRVDRERVLVVQLSGVVRGIPNTALAGFHHLAYSIRVPAVSFSGWAIWENTMTETSPINASGSSASLLLGRKLDSIPFSAYHVMLILVLG